LRRELSATPMIRQSRWLQPSQGASRRRYGWPSWLTDGLTAISLRPSAGRAVAPRDQVATSLDSLSPADRSRRSRPDRWSRPRGQSDHSEINWRSGAPIPKSSGPIAASWFTKFGIDHELPIKRTI